MNTIEIPTLLFWENGNSWYGSLGEARFFIKPELSGEGQEKQLTAQFWRGPLSMELSKVLATQSFPLSEEGIAQTAKWLQVCAQTL